MHDYLYFVKGNQCNPPVYKKSFSNNNLKKPHVLYLKRRLTLSSRVYFTNNFNGAKGIKSHLLKNEIKFTKVC